MCGLWGYVTEETTNGAWGRAKFVHQAAVAGTFRGDDSTGAVLVPHRKEPALADWCKSLGTGEEFLRTKYAKDKLAPDKAGMYRAVLGHNRSATRGSVSLENAHPFVEGDITLIHNGTLDTTYGLPIAGHKLRDKSNIEVDSHMICANLAAHDIKEVLSSLNGAFALAWHDARNDSIYMARNSQRPLYFMRPSCERTVLFASEADMLWWLAGRNNFARSPIHQLDPYVLLEFKPGEVNPLMSRFNGFVSRYQQPSYGGTGGNALAVLPAPTRPSAGAPATTVSGTATIKGEQVGITCNSTKTGTKQLDKFGFKPEDTMKFVVADVHPTTDKYCLVNGWVYYMREGRMCNMQGIVYGVTNEFAAVNKTGDWMVRPIGVRYLEKNGGTYPALILRLLGAKPQEEARQREIPLYEGPRKQWLTAADWLIATSGGCCECKNALTLEDAEDILWVADGAQPLCGQCVDDWRNESKTRGTH